MNFAGFFSGTRDGLYFVASDPTHGQELWYTDTTAAAEPITDFMPGSRWSDISDLHASPLGQAYFVHEDGLYRIFPDQQPRLLHQSSGSIEIITHFAGGVAAHERIGGNARVVFHGSNNQLTFATGSFDHLDAKNIVATGSLIVSGYDSSGDQRLWSYNGGANTLDELPDVAPEIGNTPLQLHAVMGSMSQYVSVSIDTVGSFLVNSDRSLGTKWGAFQEAMRVDGRFYYLNVNMDLYETTSLRARGKLIATGVSNIYENFDRLIVTNRNGVYLLDTTKGMVAGKVWLDRDQDGRYSRNQQRDRGVVGVTVFADTNDNGVLDRDEPWTVTGYDGLYHLSGLKFRDVPIRVTDLYKGYRSLTSGRVVVSAMHNTTFIDFGLTTKIAA